MLEITALDLGDTAALDAYADVRIAAQAVDRPDEPAPARERIIASLREANPDFSEVLRFVARRDGEGVGSATIGLLGGVNARLAVGPVTVHPRHRRRGVGTALLEAVLPRLRAHGRDVLASWGSPRAARASTGPSRAGSAWPRRGCCRR
ncbi:GNAT family N-acetyltransferase [Lentzea jiangxiensis]|uniref:N-acetyltransferase domain-containing protein n=1 Tax=Lentzea jiangxiensis TaxID=641025 RepID=A0A1H0FZ68_9PSEU|nr:GNAT family N-acetyltransferase [Lentzea jiangxiensis]SDN99943.1 hypothetical protein SAMN05421507_101996 [Lentzea jiangxiensis]